MRDRARVTPALLRGLLVLLVVALTLGVCPLTAQPAVDGKVLVYQCVATACVLIFLVGSWLENESYCAPCALFWLAAAFAGLNFAAVLVAVNVGHSLTEFSKWAALFLLFLVAAWSYRTPKQFRVFLWGVAAAMVVAAGSGLLEWVGIQPLGWLKAGKDGVGVSRVLGSAEAVSRGLLPACILSASLALRRGCRWALPIPVVLVVYGAVAGSWTAGVGLIAACVCAGVSLTARRRGMQPGVTVALVLVCVAVIGGAGMGAAWKLGARGDTAAPESRWVDSVSGAARMVADKPLLGRGPGGYVIDRPLYWSARDKERFAVSRALVRHVGSEPLEIAVDAGLAACAIYVAFLGLALAMAVRMSLDRGDGERRWLGLTLVAFFGAAFVDGLLGAGLRAPVSAYLLFVVAGVLCGVRGLDSENPAIQAAPRALWRLLAACAALAIPLLATRMFLARCELAAGRTAMQTEDYEAAQKRFAAAADRVPHSWDAQYELGMAYLKAGLPEEALSPLERAIENNPNHVEALFALARAQFNVATKARGKKSEAFLDDALSYAQRAADLHAELPESHDLMARV
ncbi:MAG TPA: tetratricopeptide repeat protein, partial [Candidatus Hydrogenedentes bacterium]|nr:tetratricopeptide repeat protein [Candidatus Hydrogenedentota bacterium]